VLGVAQEILDEYIPDPRQRRILLGLAALPLFFVIMNWFANMIANRVVSRLQEVQERE
jgi:hypothetical protein